MNRDAYNKIRCCRKIKTITVQIAGNGTDSKILHLRRLRSETLQKRLLVDCSGPIGIKATRHLGFSVAGTGPGNVYKYKLRGNGLRKNISLYGTGPGAPFIAKGRVIVINHETI